MKISDIRNAESCLVELVRRALSGEEILIGRNGKPLVKLVPVSTLTANRTGGQWHGKVRNRRRLRRPPAWNRRSVRNDAG